MSDLDGRQRALARVCLAAALPDVALALLEGDTARWRVYRDLVRNRLWAALVEALPRTLAAAGAERFGGWFTRFLDEAPPRTRYLRELWRRPSRGSSSLLLMRGRHRGSAALAGPRRRLGDTGRPTTTPTRR